MVTPGRPPRPMVDESPVETAPMVRTLLALGTFLATTAATRAGGAPPEKTDLFEANTGGYAHYRIPGLVVTKRGTLLAYCEARKSTKGDWGAIDVLMRRSTDGGTTWGPPRQVVSPPKDVTKNPVALAQKLARP